MELTRDSVLNALETSDSAVVNALIKMYYRQTADEQEAKRTGHTNGVGFNSTDAPFLSSLAEQSIERRRARKAGEIPAHYTDLSPKQIGAARKCLRKYAKQLLQIALQTQEDNARKRAEKAEGAPVGAPTQAPTPAPVAPISAPSVRSAAPVKVEEVPAYPNPCGFPNGFVIEGDNIRPKTAREFHMEGTRLYLQRKRKKEQARAEVPAAVTEFDMALAQIPDSYTPAQAQGF